MSRALLVLFIIALVQLSYLVFAAPSHSMTRIQVNPYLVIIHFTWNESWRAKGNFPRKKNRENFLYKASKPHCFRFRMDFAMCAQILTCHGLWNQPVNYTVLSHFVTTTVLVLTREMTVWKDVLWARLIFLGTASLTPPGDHESCALEESQD